MLFDQMAGVERVVVRGDQSFFGARAGYSGTGWVGGREVDPSLGEQVGDASVMRAVIGALELEHLRSAGKGTGETQAVQRRLGSRRTEA